jgi:two-component system NarL family sensor kinase
MAGKSRIALVKVPENRGKIIEDISMKLRQKVILFAVIPLLVVSIIIAVRVHRHSVLLAGQFRQVIKTAYLASKDEELKNYVAWQNVQFEDVDKPGWADEAAKEKAKATLAKLDYGQNGIFSMA